MTSQLTSLALAFCFLLQPVAARAGEAGEAAAAPIVATAEPITVSLAAPTDGVTVDVAAPDTGADATDVNADATTDATTETVTSAEADTASKGVAPMTMSSTPAPDTAPAKTMGATIKTRLPEADAATGAFKYEYPIVVPSGRNGMQPDLNLGYNSQRVGEGSEVGAGWSLNIPYIERVNKRGFDRLYVDSEFVSSIDGELINVSGGDYAAKIEPGSFMAYSFSDNAWTVRDKAGITYSYGADASARQDDAANMAHAFRWMLQEARDLNGNYVKYEYYKDQGQIYPSRIVYTGNGTADGAFEVLFARESRADAGFSNASGFTVTTAYRISEIQTRSQGSWVRKYTLAYSTGSNGKRSLLASITESAQDSGSSVVTLPATTFDYTTFSGSWAPRAGWSLPATPDFGVFFVDLNGDGYTDMLRSYSPYSGNQIREAYLNDGDGSWTLSSAWEPPVSFGSQVAANTFLDQCFRIADVNGDRLPDIVGDGQIGQTYLNTGSGWLVAPQWTTPIAFNPGYAFNGLDGANIIDINGDGLSDVVSVKTQNDYSLTATVYLNTGSGWQFDPGWIFPANLDAPGTALSDLNGDGLLDIAYSFQSSEDESIIRHAFINKGDKTFVDDSRFYLPYVLSYGGYSQDAALLDISGDGLPDNVKYYNNDYYSNGIGWPATGVPPTFPFRLIDSGYHAQAHPADIDGDGMIDFPARYEMWFQLGKRPDLLKTISYSTHGTSSVIYQPSTAYRDAQGNNANPEARTVLDTVRSIATNDLSGHVDQRNYQYSGAKQYYALTTGGPTGVIVERKFAGFAGVTEVNERGDYERSLVHQGDASDAGNGEYADEAAKVGRVYRTELGRLAQPPMTEIDQQVGDFHKWARLMSFDSSFPWLHRQNSLSRIRYYVYNPSSSYACNGVIRNCAFFDDPLNPQVCADTAVSIPANAHRDFWADFRSPSYGLVPMAPLASMTGFNLMQQLVSGDCNTSLNWEYINTNPLPGAYLDNSDYQDARFTLESYSFTGDAIKHHDSINKWDAATTAGGSRFVKLAQKVTRTFDGDSSHRDVAEAYSFDDTTGNVTQKVQWGEVTAADDGTFSDAGDDKFTTDYSYATNPSAHVLGLMCQETVLDQSSDRVKDSRWYYDGQSLGSATLGNQTTEERWVTGSSYVNTQKAYDGTYGLVATSTDPRGKVTSYAYDALNLYPASITNPLGQVTSQLYDYAYGRVRQSVDPNGRTRQTVFDGFGRVTQELQPDVASPSTLVAKTAYSYTPQTVGLLTQRTDYLDATGAVASYEYTDGLGRQIQTRVAAEGTNNFAVSDTAYDNLGHVAKKSLPYFSTGSAMTSPTTTAALFTTYAYDPLGRVTSATDAVGTTTTAYSDWKTTVTDANGHPKDTYADAYVNLVRVDEHDGANTYTTAYAYDYVGGLTGMTDALGNIRAFAYDGLGRRLSAEDLHAPGDATFGLWQYVYDDAGNLTQRIDAKGQVVNWTYDDLNRKTAEDYAGQAGTEVTYAYDTCQDGVGRLCGETSAALAKTLTYDPLGRLALETASIAGTTYATGHEYDRRGLETLTVSPDGSQVRNAYDPASGLLAVVQRRETTDPGWLGVATLTHAPTGAVATVAYANGATTTNTFDAAHLYRLTSKSTSAGGRGVQNLSYSYDAVGNVTGLVDSSVTSTAKTASYIYDDLNRLTSVSSAKYAAPVYSEEYAYGPTGNLLSKTVTANENENILNSAFELAPTFVAAQTSSNYMNGTAAGSSTNKTYGWYFWRSAGTGSGMFDPNEKHSGQYSAKLHLDAAGGVNLVSNLGTTSYQAGGSRFPVIPGHTYRATVWMKTANTSGATTSNGFYATLRVTGPTGANTHSTSFIPNTKTDTGWTKYELNYTAVAGDAWGAITLSGLSGSGNTFAGDAWFDDVSVVDIAELAAPGEGQLVQNADLEDVPPFISAQTTSGRYVDGTATGSTANAASHWYAGMGGAAGDRYVMFDTSEKHGGQASLKMHLNAGSYVEFRSNNATGYWGNNPVKQLVVVPGHAYKFSGWMKVASVAGDSSGGFKIAALLSKADGTSSETVDLMGYKKANQDWTYYEKTFTSKATSAAGHVELRGYGHTGAATLSGDAWFDDVSLVDLDGAPSAAGTVTYTYQYGGSQGSSYANPHAVTSVEYSTGASGSFGYDQNGNLESVAVENALGRPAPSAARSYAWDYNNRLAQTLTGTATLAYTYDAGGQRASLGDGTSTTYFPTGSYESTAGVPTKHLSADGVTLANVTDTGAAAAPRYVHTDHLTGASVVTGQAGTVDEQLDYYPYGGVRIDQKAGTFSERRQFAGSEHDQASGLNYMKARYYDPSTGRFLSQDPVYWELGGVKLGEMLLRNQYKLKHPDVVAEAMSRGAAAADLNRILLFDFLSQPQLLNSYSYVSNNPLKYTDPNGETQGAERLVNGLSNRGWKTDAQLTDISKIPTTISTPDKAHKDDTRISSPGSTRDSSKIGPDRPKSPSQDQRRNWANHLDSAAKIADSVHEVAETSGVSMAVTMSTAEVASSQVSPQAGAAVVAAYSLVEFGVQVVSGLSYAAKAGLDFASSWLINP